MKHEWRKKEKETYLPNNAPTVINVPEFQFVTIEGEGNPNTDFFKKCIEVLYAVSYAIKMILKKGDDQPKGYYDYTVYPLEGIWDISEKAKKNFDGTIHKDDFVYKLMIRQPSFVSKAFFNKMVQLVKDKKGLGLIDTINFETIKEGKCIQMMHLGSYDDEPKSFKHMEVFSEKENLLRKTKSHREIYLTDFRKVAPEKIKNSIKISS